MNISGSQLFSLYDTFKRRDLSTQSCKHALLQQELSALCRQSDLFTLEVIGQSSEGRDISTVRCGWGATPILLWSQMHGDESTATLSLLDIFQLFVAENSSHDWVEQILASLSLVFIPMLNPDGAERVQRRTALTIDLNRDALALATPEGRLLKGMQSRYKPVFAFNLHDQELSSVGTTTSVTALALLAPAADIQRSEGPTRRRAIQVVDELIPQLEEFAGGHIATYDDTFEPRAFGDNMQKWGTSTILIEAGHWYDDPEKEFVRKLNSIAILAALSSIATESYKSCSGEHYRALVPNGKKIYDVVLRNITAVSRSGWEGRIDIGLGYGLMAPREKQLDTFTVKDIGDLSTYGALRTIDGSSLRISLERVPLETSVHLSSLLDGSL